MASLPPGAPAPPAIQLRVVQGVDFKKLPLTPAEGNVFSRIMAGATSEAQIASAAGIQLDTVSRCVERLVELKAVERWDPVKAAQLEETAAAGRLALGGLGTLAAAQSIPPTPGLYDPRDLEERVDLEPEKRRLILEAFHRLDHLDYYELLGVHRLVDRKQVKSAYYGIAPDFHPDKYFKRNLGSYRARIEAIFARLTLAHDVLSSKQKRSEYDEYLDMMERNRAAVAAAQQHDVAVQHARSLAEQAARAAVGGSMPPPVDGSAAQALADRKRALAMKLMGGQKRPSMSPPPSGHDARAAAEALRNRFEHARVEATKRQVFHYIAVGRDALTKHDYAAAANAYRIAASLNPDDPMLQRDAQEVIQQANRALADSFLKQGDYELSQERFSEAAISFGKAANGRPDDPRGFDRAAYSTFRAGSSPRRAVEYARRAVELRPDHWPYRITLAYCFVAAGLSASVEAELARVLEGARNDEKAMAQIQAVREYMKQVLASAS
jgi:tetratricopeptide (TPR) repeat protein